MYCGRTAHFESSFAKSNLWSSPSRNLAQPLFFAGFETDYIFLKASHFKWLFYNMQIEIIERLTSDSSRSVKTTFPFFPPPFLRDSLHFYGSSQMVTPNIFTTIPDACLAEMSFWEIKANEKCYVVGMAVTRHPGLDSRLNCYRFYMFSLFVYCSHWS